MKEDPRIIISRFSGPVTSEGVTVDVQIYCLEGSNEWSLEVVDEKGTSTVWDDVFQSDEDAHAEFLRTLKEEGILGLLRASPRVVH